MAAQDHIDYVNKALASGYSKEQITQNLIQTGWSQQDVDEAFAAQPATTTPVQPKKGKLALVVAAIVLITVAAAVGIYFMNAAAAGGESATATPTATPTVEATQAPATTGIGNATPAETLTPSGTPTATPTVPPQGCAYSNPACGEGHQCVNNVCVLTQPLYSFTYVGLPSTDKNNPTQFVADGKHYSVYQTNWFYWTKKPEGCLLAFSSQDDSQIDGTTIILTPSILTEPKNLTYEYPHFAVNIYFAKNGVCDAPIYFRKKEYDYLKQNDWFALVCEKPCPIPTGLLDKELDGLKKAADALAQTIGVQRPPDMYQPVLSGYPPEGDEGAPISVYSESPLSQTPVSIRFNVDSMCPYGAYGHTRGMQAGNAFSSSNKRTLGETIICLYEYELNQTGSIYVPFTEENAQQLKGQLLFAHEGVHVFFPDSQYEIQEPFAKTVSFIISHDGSDPSMPKIDSLCDPFLENNTYNGLTYYLCKLNGFDKKDLAPFFQKMNEKYNAKVGLYNSNLRSPSPTYFSNYGLTNSEIKQILDQITGQDTSKAFQNANISIS